ELASTHDDPRVAVELRLAPSEELRRGLRALAVESLNLREVGMAEDALVGRRHAVPQVGAHDLARGLALLGRQVALDRGRSREVVREARVPRVRPRAVLDLDGRRTLRGPESERLEVRLVAHAQGLDPEVA